MDGHGAVVGKMLVPDERGMSEPGPGYQRLAAWQKSMDLVEAVYTASSGWPREELYGLTSQARRAAVAIPSNIEEGHGRTGPREFAHHVSIAFGSLSELETQILIAQRLGYSHQEDTAAIAAKLAEVRRIIRGQLTSLRQRALEQSKP